MRETCIARSGSKSISGNRQYYLLDSRIQTFDTRINGVRTGQCEAGSIRVIDSHDRWVDEGAHRTFHVTLDRGIRARNSFREKRFRAKSHLLSRIIISRRYLWEYLYVRTNGSYVAVNLISLSRICSYTSSSLMISIIYFMLLLTAEEKVESNIYIILFF